MYLSLGLLSHTPRCGAPERAKYRFAGRGATCAAHGGSGFSFTLGAHLGTVLLWISFTLLAHHPGRLRLARDALL